MSRMLRVSPIGNSDASVTAGVHTLYILDLSLQGVIWFLMCINLDVEQIFGGFLIFRPFQCLKVSVNKT